LGGTLHAALEAAGIDLLIFDMDGVLVDVADSYRTTVALAVEIYVRDVARLPAPGSISSQLVSAWKGAGGFNNDWDLTAAIAGAVICKDGDLGAVVALANDVGAEGGGLAGLEAVLGRVATAAVRYSGDVGDPYDIKRIFQELYLGGPRFKASTGLLPAHVGLDAPGLCDREFAILSAAVCQALAARMPLAIATGRPADEAYEALTRMGLRAHFGAVVTDDDVRAESRRSGLAFADLAKPAPWPLQEAHRRAAPDAQHPAYVGDLPDDMTAARAAGMFSVGIGSPTPPAGAELALSHPDLLMEISGS
jgi:HAD superfamily hydrolase (TIGR01548 family)